MIKAPRKDPRIVPVPPKTDVPPRKTDARKGRDQAYQHEGLDAGTPGIDAHQFGAVDVVTSQIDVCAESMAVEQHPTKDRNYDQPNHLHWEKSTDFTDQKWVKDGSFYIIQSEIRPLGEHQHSTPPEELRTDGHNE
jgi:hypothetical protein